MRVQIRALLVILVAMATMAPVCVLSGGDTITTSSTVELSAGALVEVIGENAEVRVTRVPSDTLELTTTLHNEEYVDFYTQSLTPIPVDHFVISATTSTGGANRANSVIEIGIPDGTNLVVRTTNRPISVDSVELISASLTTSNGEILVTNASGDFDLSTTNSEVTVQSVDGPVNVATTNAHVWFESLVDKGTNSISTSNGDISVRLLNGSHVSTSGSTRNGAVTVDGGDVGVTRDGDVATVEHQTGNGTATLNITNGPGAIHINPETIAVFDGDS